MDGFGRSKPHPSNLLSSLSTSKGEEQAPFSLFNPEWGKKHVKKAF